MFARTLALFAGASLIGTDTEAVALSEPDLAFATGLLRRHGRWIGTVITTTPHRVTLGLTATEKAWPLADAASAEPTVVVTFDPVAARWSRTDFRDKTPDLTDFM